MTVSGNRRSFRSGKELDLAPHTINLSLGVHGKTELLPPSDILEQTTMCGHALVATALTRQLKAEVAAGKLDAKEARASTGGAVRMRHL